MSDKHVVDVAAAIVVDVIVVGLQRISRDLWRPHWGDGIVMELRNIYKLQREYYWIDWS